MMTGMSGVVKLETGTLRSLKSTLTFAADPFLILSSFDSLDPPGLLTLTSDLLDDWRDVDFGGFFVVLILDNFGDSVDLCFRITDGFMVDAEDDRVVL